MHPGKIMPAIQGSLVANGVAAVPRAAGQRGMAVLGVSGVGGLAAAGVVVAVEAAGGRRRAGRELSKQMSESCSAQVMSRSRSKSAVRWEPQQAVVQQQCARQLCPCASAPAAVVVRNAGLARLHSGGRS